MYVNEATDRSTHPIYPQHAPTTRQTNTAAAEVLYQVVIDECKRQQEQEESTGAAASEGGVILDVCCGTGTIGICAAVQLAAAQEQKRGTKRKAEGEGQQEEGGGGGESGGKTKVVLGIELCPTAVEDARVNAGRNGVANAVFVCAKGMGLGSGWIVRFGLIVQLSDVTNLPQNLAAEDVLGGALDGSISGACVWWETRSFSFPTSFMSRAHNLTSTNTYNRRAAPGDDEGGRAVAHRHRGPAPRRAAQRLPPVRVAVGRAWQASRDRTRKCCITQTANRLKLTRHKPQTTNHSALRNSPKVRHVIYVSCNPTKSLCKDAVTLCGPRSAKFHGEAFRPVKAIPVDIFPHTEHCEMVVCFSRESESGGGDGKQGEAKVEAGSAEAGAAAVEGDGEGGGES